MERQVDLTTLIDKQVGDAAVELGISPVEVVDYLNKRGFYVRGDGTITDDWDEVEDDTDQEELDGCECCGKRDWAVVQRIKYYRRLNEAGDDGEDVTPGVKFGHDFSEYYCERCAKKRWGIDVTEAGTNGGGE